MSNEPYSCVLDGVTGARLVVLLFKNVNNAETVTSNVVTGSWRCAAVKPALVLEPLQLAAAANRAALADHCGTLVTKTVYSEILYNLSITKNISQSLSRFGIQRDRDMLVCFLVHNCDDVEYVNKIAEQIDGERCAMSSLSSFTDMKEVKSAYKLNNLKSDIDLIDVIVSKMATKSFVNH